jgi:branched-chain amino acid transport system substrate-binding protein
MKRNAIAFAAALCAFGSAHAQISGDTIKIGFITDMSGVYSDIDGQGGAEAIKMAIADAGGAINGKKIEFVFADHQNKADIATSRAWTCWLAAPIPAPTWRWPKSPLTRKRSSW